MKVKKKIAAAILGAMFVFGFQVPSAFAEIVEADGEYFMGDGTEENQVVAKERARKEALRNASERVCVLVESFSEVIDGELNQDEIRTISANVLKVISSTVRPAVVGETVKYICHITVSVEKENVLNYINQNSKGDIEDATRRIRELEEENKRIREENERIKKEFKTANETERKRLNEEIKRNERQFTALQYTEQGEAYYAKRNYSKAVETLNKAIEINPDYPNAWAWLGAVYNDFGNTDKAIECNDKAIALDPKNAPAWNNLGVSYNHLGDMNRSIECYQKAIDFDSTFVYPWSNLGRSYAESGNFNKAIEYCNKGVELNPKIAYPWICLGMAWQSGGNNAKALEYCQKAVEVDPKFQLAWSFLGDAYLAAGNKIKADECFNTSNNLIREQMKTYPEDAMAWANLAGNYIKLGRYADAVNCCQKAIEMNPHFTSAWFELSIAQIQARNYEAALSALNKAVELAPNNETLRKTRDMLAAQLRR